MFTINNSAGAGSALSDVQLRFLSSGLSTPSTAALLHLCRKQQQHPPLAAAKRRSNTVPSRLVSCGATVASPPPPPGLHGQSPIDRLSESIFHLNSIADVRQRTTSLLSYAASLPPFPDSQRTTENRVIGCTARVWVAAELKADGRMRFLGDSDSDITKGFCGVLVKALDMATPEEVMSVTVDMLSDLGYGLSSASRANTWYNVLLAMQKRTEKELARAEGRNDVELFPSLLISGDGLSAQGSFALSQIKYLEPNRSKVKSLVELLQQKKIGVVAHFYMDPEVQGVLAAAKEEWPHIHISDSLVMADRAVKMVEAGCKHIAVLGVDFMSENVRAILDKAGHEQINVYRMSSERIGCSLAEAAEEKKYLEFLEEASQNTPALHVVYINTSLETKAMAHSIVPTITCTSSNVVQTVLQAFAQVSDVTIWYGPDSYMGANLAEMFRQIAQMSDEDIAAIHPLHNRQSIISLLPRLHYYNDGACIVHDLFGHQVVSRVRKTYSDAFLTAHFEVPGEMFALAMEAKFRGMGVVGSTQNILDFITHHVKQAIKRNIEDKLQFILGTEAGMVTAIVGAVRKILAESVAEGKGNKVEVEIVFPVSSDAIAAVPSNSSSNSTDEHNISKLHVVPGVASGEGCSMTGGCASCPYMKMNSLDALLRVCRMLNTPMEHALDLQQARRFDTSTVAGVSVADLGCEPILHMRYFQSNGRLPQTLVDQILGSKTAS